MRPKALSLFENLIQDRPRKEDRLTELLKDPEMDGTPDWFMFVPKYFNDALDIKQTPRKVDGKTSLVWTQGSSFAFNAGDVLYDTPSSQEQWSEALKKVKLCIQITKSIAANGGQGTQRESGEVVFDIMIPNAEKTKLIPAGSQRMTQDELLRFLITGDGLKTEK